MKQFPLEPVSVLGTPKLEEDATPIELSEASLSALFILGSNLIETMSSLDLIGSLITNKLYGSSLVEWLQKKMPRDMEVKGKYLHWNSLESYGQLVSPRIRIINVEFALLTKLLKNLNGQSDILLEDTSSLHLRAYYVEPAWLNKVKAGKDYPLFLDMMWYTLVQRALGTPLIRGDLSSLAQDCVVRWFHLAKGHADGNLPFQEMEKVVQLQPNGKLLAQAHLQFGRSFEIVNESYRHFKILQKLQDSIGPFLASLRLFNIKKGEIYSFYDFFYDHLIENWAQSTLAQVRESCIIEMNKSDVQIYPEMVLLELIGSSITNQSDGTSPLVELLRKKKGMQAMVKIFQGSLLEGYGQQQTLRTRIASFLGREFENHQHLLNVPEIEQRFAQRIGSRVQPIKCSLLVNMLPEIDAAVRASVCSPAENDKEKLAMLSLVIIGVQDEDNYKIEIQLEATGSLPMNELKQALQLLDMSITDDNEESMKMRKSAGLILHLAEVFTALFSYVFITYKFQLKKMIMLEKLKDDMQRRHLTWNELWKEVNKLRLLALFLRSYLLHLADLIRHHEIQQDISTLRMLLPSVIEKLERSIRQLDLLVQEKIEIDGDDDALLSTQQLPYILCEFHELIQLVYYEKGTKILRLANKFVPRHYSSSIPTRLGTVEELLGGLKEEERRSLKNDFFLFHSDVAHSAYLELNDLLLSLLIHGALYNPNKVQLGLRSISNHTTIAIESLESSQLTIIAMQCLLLSNVAAWSAEKVFVCLYLLLDLYLLLSNKCIIHANLPIGLKAVYCRRNLD